ncbi:Copper chaperone CopZ [Arthrobacter subterraneus]|uniref:Copper chaperone CopZ n=1 Tax=Arthrobacter subterraneus TaxID=335973 RepID=A0A1G8PZC6_9MICC|nr:heavy-metal-associated domain-containing protein [Arthrobacter subterraneus]SDI97879.1 Copper chaperone CopZ [Arthrobacter subterraneus]
MSTTSVNISGMTCNHCVASVTEELSELDGVTNVDIVLNRGGISTATISGPEELDTQKITEAVAEAGYEVVPPSA